MIVEFIGPSGAGKSTLMHGVRRNAPRDRPVATAWDLVLGPRRGWITQPTAVNLIAEVVCLPAFARHVREHADFLRFALRRIIETAPTHVARANYARNVVRRVGLYEYTRKARRPDIVLLDEGVVLLAYHLLVYSREGVNRGEIDRFARLVPKPDRLVYVKAPISVLVERSRSRSDPRRELTGKSPAQVRRSLEQACEVFDALTSSTALRDRVITVEGVDGTAQDQQIVARRVLSAITDGAPRRR